jgi:hypothetical protein
MGTSLSPIGTPSVIAQDSYSTLYQLSRSGPEDFDALLLRLTEHRDAHTRYRTTIINKRQIEDLEMQQNRRAEDEKYHASLVNRVQEDQQRRKTRAAEDRKFEAVQRGLEAQEDASLHMIIYIIFKLTTDVETLAETEAEQTMSATDRLCLNANATNGSTKTIKPTWRIRIRLGDDPCRIDPKSILSE